MTFEWSITHHFELHWGGMGARTELWAASMLVRDISYFLPVLFHVAVLWIPTCDSTQQWWVCDLSGVSHSDWSQLVSEWEVGVMELISIFYHSLCCTVQYESNDWHQSNWLSLIFIAWRSLHRLQSENSKRKLHEEHAVTNQPPPNKQCYSTLGIINAVCGGMKAFITQRCQNIAASS